MKIDIKSPFTLPCGVTLNNRVVKAALTERIAGVDHLPNENLLRLYNHWGKSGAAVLLTGNIQVDRRYLESTGNVVVEKDTPLEPFRTWTKGHADSDTQLWAQLSHAGRQSTRFSTRFPVSASDVQLKKMGLFARPKALSEEGIEDVIARFVHAAEFCKNAGFAGIQFHAAHGYLLSQFLSPKTNRRIDAWGGSIDNRARLLLTIVELSRNAVGPNFPISVKLNSADFQRGGFDEEDSQYVIKQLEERGIDLLEISGGTYERSAMMGVGMKETTRSREAYFLDFAKKVRSECKVPFMVTGGFRTRAVCDEALQNDQLDLIGFGRPFLIEDHFPKDFLQNSSAVVTDPKVKIIDHNNVDAAEAGFYDLQIKRLSRGKALKQNYSALRVAAHIPTIEMRMGLRNWLFG